ncbi:MAG: hypothetical protein Q9195_005388 [Heterodermia aff. obscurata]
MPESTSLPPLMAHAVNDEKLVRWFLRQGADPNASSEMCDITPLSYAVQQAPFEVIKLLFHHGGSTAQGQLLNMASDRTDPDSVAILQFLFDHGDTRINDTYLPSRSEIQLRSCINNAAPLHHAARVGNIDTVRWLLQHGANPWQRTVVTIGYGTTPMDSAHYGNHTDIVELLHEAIMVFPGTPEPILPKPQTDIKIVDEANKHYYESTLKGMRSDINHGNGDRSRGPGAMDYSFELMILELMAGQRDTKSRDSSDYSDGHDEESRANIPEELRVQLMLQEQQEKKRQLMKRHELSMLRQRGVDEKDQSNFDFMDDIGHRPRSSVAVPSTDDSEQMKPSDQVVQPSTGLSSRFWASFGWK